MSNLHVVEPVTETPELDDKQEKMIDFIRSFRALEDAMEPYKEQKRELRKDFKDQGWLTKDEISMTTKAYRMMNTKNFDMDEFHEDFRYPHYSGRKKLMMLEYYRIREDAVPPEPRQPIGCWVGCSLQSRRCSLAGAYL